MFAMEPHVCALWPTSVGSSGLTRHLQATPAQAPVQQKCIMHHVEVLVCVTGPSRSTGHPWTNTQVRRST